MRKLLQRRLQLHEIIVVTVIGVLAGTYIWRPAIQKYVSDHPEVARQPPTVDSIDPTQQGVPSDSSEE